MIGRLVDGRYRIESFLARGGMATVYEATDVRLDRLVALKIMHTGLAEDDAFAALSAWLRARPGVLVWIFRGSGAILVGLGVRLAFERR